MSEYQQYYDAFTARLQHGEGLAPEECRCHGGGWILSDLDTWHRCPDHYTAGQGHPDDDEQEQNDPAPVDNAPYGQVADDGDVPF